MQETSCLRRGVWPALRLLMWDTQQGKLCWGFPVPIPGADVDCDWGVKSLWLLKEPIKPLPEGGGGLLDPLRLTVLQS